MNKLGVWSLIAVALIASPALGDNIYKYRDAEGGILFTDRPQARVPAKYTLLSVRKGWSYQPHPLSAFQRHRYDTLIFQAAREFDVDAALIKAVIHAESSFDRHAVSHAGAQGLMQLMPQTARALGVTNPFDARANIRGGTRFLARLEQRFSSLELVLAAYNAGPGNVRRYGGIPPFPETRAYVKKVKQFLAVYETRMAPEVAVSR